ncbi:hypothetical protein GTR04_2778 [Trichophyton interdigitale]|nr:hypothetical protein GY631_6766 [Trichophyton interdigitale]KAG5218869.1 hypothetical protein GY632_5125 [Trichophyton interdigitale]KAG8209864.1 hypothetical protein GTR04_2778 [Trichophyton interdigitale]
MAYYEHEPDFSVHFGKTTCLLCRHVATPQSPTLDLHGHDLGTRECQRLCLVCMIHPIEKPWMHKLCYDLLKASNRPNEPTLEDLQRFGKAVMPLYKPVDKEDIDSASSREGLFSSHARPVVERSFRIDLFERLPAEIQAIILSYIGPCWYLIVLGESRRLIEELRSGRTSRQSEQISLEKEVYISRIPYQGNSYISTISNELPEPGLDGLKLECLKIPDNLSKIVLSTDHIGVRGIRFVVEGGTSPPSDGSPWYEFVPIPDRSQALHVATEGLFVRRMWRVEGEKTHNNSPLWSSPSPPAFQPWNMYDDRGGRRLDYVNLDEEGVQGLVMCCYGVANGGLFAFSGVSKPFKRFVTSMQQNIRTGPIFWMYFPINDGEQIEAAWVRKIKGLYGQMSNPVLVIKTTFGRTATFGPYHREDYRREDELIPLVKDSDGTISGFIHDGLDTDKHEISLLGLTCRNQDGNNNDNGNGNGNGSNDDHNHEREPNDNNNGTKLATPPVENYISPPPYAVDGLQALNWYMTEARLDGVCRVRVCRDLEQAHNPCIGMLLYYDNGRAEALGQIRWDQEVSRDISVPVRLRREKLDGNPYVADVQGMGGAGCGATEDEPGDGWLALPRTGTMVWWFCISRDIISVYGHCTYCR